MWWGFEYWAGAYIGNGRRLRVGNHVGIGKNFKMLNADITNYCTLNLTDKTNIYYMLLSFM